MLARLIRLRFGAPGLEVEGHIAGGSPEQLEGWLEGFATAESLDEVFAGWFDRDVARARRRGSPPSAGCAGPSPVEGWAR